MSNYAEMMAVSDMKMVVLEAGFRDPEIVITHLSKGMTRGLDGTVTIGGQSINEAVDLFAASHPYMVKEIETPTPEEADLNIKAIYAARKGNQNGYDY